MLPANLHGTALVLRESGVLVVGPSGVGKTTLALSLIDHAAARGWFARLVADDQVFVTARSGRLLATAPASIAGLAEIHGLGPSAVPHEPAVIIDLVVRLMPDAAAPRFQTLDAEEVQGLAVPRISLSGRRTRASVLAVFACLAGIAAA